MELNEVRGQYFEYLCELVVEESNQYKYNFLLRNLHMVPALALIPDDENRLEWGLYNRQLFQIQAEGLSEFTDDEIETALDPQCSMLELLIHLARETADNTCWDLPWINGLSIIFWELVANSGLDQYHDDEVTYSVDMQTDMKRRIQDINERKYDHYGQGYWFELKYPRNGVDMTKIDMYKQIWLYVQDREGTR